MDILKFGIENVLYPYMEKRRGNRVRQYTEELKASQNLPRGAIEELQKKKLKKMLLFCADKVPAYSYLDRAEIESDPFFVLTNRVHVLGKKAFKEDSESYMAAGIPQSRLIPNVTGGSTGIPLKFYMDRYQVEHFEAARWRSLSWHDVSYGSRCVMIWANPIDLSKAYQDRWALKERLLKNRRIISTYTLSDDKAGEYVRMINSYKPEYLYGYASSLVAFANIIKKYGAHKLKIKLKLVCSTAETLYPEQQALIEEVFGCPVVGEYGAHDGGILAYGCPRGKLHIAEENLIIEVLDPVTHEPLPLGKVGTLAITDLNMSVQPRLRYLIGDLGALCEEQCGCGLGLRVLSELAGREDDLLVRSDGSLAHGDIIARYVRHFLQVRQYRFVQHSRQKATLYLETEPDEELAAKAGGGLAEALGGIDVAVEFVDELKPSASGKMRYSIREFPLS